MSFTEKVVQVVQRAPTALHTAETIGRSLKVDRKAVAKVLARLAHQNKIARVQVGHYRWHSDDDNPVLEPQEKLRPKEAPRAPLAPDSYRLLQFWVKPTDVEIVCAFVDWINRELPDYLRSR